MKSRYITFAINNKRFLSFGLALAFFSSFGQTYFIGLFGSDIREEFNLTHGGFGSTYTLATGVSAAVLIWVGRLIDKIDLRLFTLGSCLLLTGACFMIGFAEGITLLGIALFTLRLSGQGLMTHIYSTAMGRYFNKDRGKALSIATLGHPLGEAILPSIVVILISIIGWQETWIAFGFFNILLLLPLVIWLLKGQKERDVQLSRAILKTKNIKIKDWSIIEVLQDIRFFAVLGVILAPAFLLTGVFFHQAHLADEKNWTMVWLATSFSAFAASSVFTMLVSGLLIDKFGATKTLLVMPIPLAVAMVIMAYSNHLIAAPFLMLSCGVCVGMVFTSGAAIWPELYGEKNLGSIRALVTALIIGASAISPAIFGFLIDEGTLMSQLALGGLGWCLISAVFLLCVLMRKGFN